MDHINIFNPYKNKPLYHEDQLTRAFLILVKNVKLVEMSFLDLIIEKMNKEDIDILPKKIINKPGGLEVIETQVRSTTKERLKNECGRLVSIIITDKRLKEKCKVKRSNRKAVYDGFVRYNSDWVFIIENKPDHRNIWLDQLSSKFNENYEIEQTPIVLTWKEIIRRLSLLIENNLIYSSDLNIVSDFLEYVSHYFTELNPYDKFSLSKGNEYLLNQRCIEIMKQTNLGKIEYHRGWHHYIKIEDKPGVKQIALYPEVNSSDSISINLILYPGDTMGQARSFYSSLDISKIKNLKNTGWHISSNFHFSYRASNLVWTNVKLPIEDYLKYWKEIVLKSELNQIHHSEWNNYFDKLKKLKMLDENDMSEIQEKIINTKMKKINVCPGIGFEFSWSYQDAIAIDDKSSKTFKKEVLRKIKDIYRIW